MRAAWRAGDIRVAEARLMATLPEGTLMHRAAAGLARRCANLLAGAGGVYGAKVHLIVGAGDNGGDALFAGALLARRGAVVSAQLLAPQRAHGGGLAAARSAGVRIVAGLPVSADLIVDGIVGIGATGSLRGPALDVVEQLTDVHPQVAVRAGHGGAPIVVSVDLPSGVDVDTGAVPGVAVRADVTVAFGCLKPALVVGPAAVLAGHVDLVDIGLPWLDAAPAIWLPDAGDVLRWWPRPSANSDKYTRGVAGVATGSAAYPGAALMSVAGALAGPAGMIRYAGAAAADIARAHPSTVVSTQVADAGRVQAWLCGCGLGTDERALDEVRTVLGSPVPVVLDADALTLLHNGTLLDWLRRRDAPTVVTPHDREFVRIAGDQVGPDRAEAARQVAARLGVVVLLKGDRTVVATPEGATWANPTGTAALATAGSGDVLAGLLVSLLAAGVSADRAAVAAAFVHGLAGRRAAARLADTGQADVRRAEARRAGTGLGDEAAPSTAVGPPVTALDVIDALPAVIAGLSGG